MEVIFFSIVLQDIPWTVIESPTRFPPRATWQQVKINKHEHVKPASFLSELTLFKIVHVDLVRLVRESEGCKSLLSDWLGHTLPGGSTTQINWERTLCNGWGHSASMRDLCNQAPAYLPKANGIVECWHWTLKTASTSVCNIWTQRLPRIVLGLRGFKPHLFKGMSPHQPPLELKSSLFGLSE